VHVCWRHVVAVLALNNSNFSPDEPMYTHVTS
jgi:hypothetical protein